jgi:radical SAM protein with 4Fe4S-binding SPASM domain
MALKAKLKNWVLWKRHELQQEKLVREHPLRYLFMEVTRRCNLACLYCGSSCTGKEPEGEMTSDEWVGVIQQIAEDFDSKDIMVAVTGGEPLVKEGIFDIFAALNQYGFRYGMVCNGVLLDEAAASRLVEVGIGSISLSMDALPEENDKLRGRGASAAVEQAVRNLKDAGYKGKLEIISTITKPAVAGLEEMRKYVGGQLKVPLWRAAPVMPIGRAAEHPELIPDEKDIRAMLEWMKESRKDGLLPKPEFSEEGFLGYRFEGVVRPYLVSCRAGITVGGIRYDGRIGACPELTEAFDQGDIKQQRFKEVWETKYENMRDRSWTRKKQPCDNCKHFSACRGGSLHLYEDTDSEILRCLYLMCKSTDGMTITLGGCCTPGFYE